MPKDSRKVVIVLSILTLIALIFVQFNPFQAINLLGYFYLLSLISRWIPMVFLGLIITFIIGFSIKNKARWWITAWGCLLAPFYVALFFMVLGYDLPFA